MVIFSHRGMGFAKEENSLDALSYAVKKGFSVEIDIRLRKNNIVLSHDCIEKTKALTEFSGLLAIIKNNPQVFFALHLKEDSSLLFKKIGSSIRPFKNSFIFVTDFKQDNFISDMSEIIDKEQLALYINCKELDLGLLNKVDYLWLDETKTDLYKSLDYFIRSKKRIVCCSPELFKIDYSQKLPEFKNILLAKRKDIFGVCTDFPTSILNKDRPLCPVCEYTGLFKFIEKINNYTILRCSSCNLEFSDPMQCNYGYYENLHYADDPNLYSVLNLSKQEFLDKAAGLSNNVNRQPHNLILKWIDKNLKKGSTILDIGCGVGWFIASLEAEGFNPVGIEVSTKVVKMLRDKGFQVYMGPLDAINSILPIPDLVVLLGVIEHVEDPVGLLKKIKEKFPKAILLLTIPNPRKWSIHYSEFPPNHLTPVWSEESLKIALRRAGFFLKELCFPDVSSDEIWFFFLDRLFLKLGLRKKGYFVGLTSDINKGRGFIKTIFKAFYRALEKVNIIAKYISRPLLNKISVELKKKECSASSAFAIAYPD